MDSIGLRVLLAEDNLLNQIVAQRLLSKLGHHIDTVSNGIEAFEAVQRTAYDVVLMDLQMPQMDGLLATRKIRDELPADRQPYVIALTASLLIEDQTACDRAGMNAYLAKPVRGKDLQAALAVVSAGSWTPRIDGPGSTGTGDPVRGGQPEPALPVIELNRDAAIRQRLAALRDPDEQIARVDPEAPDDWVLGLLTSFVSQAPHMLDLLQDAVHAGASELVTDLAHSLKGSALNLGADHLGQLLERVEILAESRAGAEVDAILEPIDDELTAVLVTMTRIARQ